jgi:hypothetical protein
MSKFKVGNPWKTGKTNSERKGIWATSERKGIWATDSEALKRRYKGVLQKLNKLLFGEN